MPADMTALLASARNNLGITWEDPAGDLALRGMLQRGMNYLDKMAGQPLDYNAPGAAQGLLYSYCIYERSQALDEFQKNYMHELLTLKIEGWECIAETGEADV